MFVWAASFLLFLSNPLSFPSAASARACPPVAPLKVLDF
jgi:hypothetical protein